MKITMTKLQKALLIVLSLSTSTAFAAGGGAIVSDPGAMEGKHFDKKGKYPSSYTIKMQEMSRKTLPFEDKTDIEEAKKLYE